MRQIEFTSIGSNTILGNFSAGDVARCDDALARHLVDEARVARYVPQRERQTEPPAPEVRPARARKGRK